jgi:tetratricopeptide (TPR) repeat protein
MATDPAVLARAWRAHQSGDSARAIETYRQVLQADPGNADVWCLLGIVQRAAGQAEEAVASYREALRLRPDFVEAWNNLGNALVNQKKPEEALAAFRQVLRLRPDYAEAHNNLAAALRLLGQWTEAERHYREAVRLKLDYADAHANLGVALQGLGQLEQAEASYRAALRLRPDYPEALTNLGTLLTRLGRHDEALACHRQALRLRPAYLDARCNLGNALLAQKRHAEAEACYREALRLRPDYAEGHHNLGAALAEQGKLEEAVACFRAALRLRPDYVEACGNLGTALIALGKPDEAVAVHDLMLRLRPDNADAHLCRALACLLLGDWRQGWADYEWRWKCEEFCGLPYREPLWDGTSLTGRTILLHAEQGLGDTLLFIRYAPLVKQRGGTVLFACPKALLPLLATGTRKVAGIDRFVEQGTPLPPFDCHAPLLSLPGIFGTTPDTVPDGVPYVFADPGLMDQWRRELASWPGFKVGIAWQGNPGFKADRLRSIPLARFAPLAQVHGVQLFSLQKGFGSEQLRSIDFPVVDLGSRLDQTGGAFVDTAAVLTQLDLVVTADTAVAHLAGALGVPVWLALAFSAHWTWLLQRTDSPWYPTMRLFRQQRSGDWEEVFERLAGELRRLAAAPRMLRPITVEIAPGELLDKITILQIKSERIAEPAKLDNVRRELAVLEAARDRSVPASAELTELTAELKRTNEALWQVEDDIRGCEREQDFGPRFVELARSVYRHNDHRAALKRRINDLLGSFLKEEKAYDAETRRPG